MPILKNFRNTIEVVLPKTGGKVMIYDCLLAKDSIEMDKIYLSDADVSVSAGKVSTPKINVKVSKYYDSMDLSLKSMVHEWDFTDNDGNQIDPTPENIKKLPKEDFDYLISKIDKQIADKRLTQSKKKA